MAEQNEFEHGFAEDGEERMARRALRSLADQPAPPVHTELADLVARGRRRLIGQRLAAGAGVIAVLGVVALGASLLAHRGPAGVGAADQGVSVATSTSATSGFLPGWSTPPVPDTTRTQRPEATVQPTQDAPMATPGTGPTSTAPVQATTATSAPAARLVPTTADLSGLRDSVLAALADLGLTGAPDRGAAQGQLLIEVNGGQLNVQPGAYSGTPAEQADADLPASGPAGTLRRTMPDGTVLQLSPAASTAQTVRIYRPAGTEYTLTGSGWRARPLTDIQLARLAEVLAGLT